MNDIAISRQLRCSTVTVTTVTAEKHQSKLWFTHLRSESGLAARRCRPCRPTLSHYRILEQIGMGADYKAEDTQGCTILVGRARLRGTG